jgi:DNA-binding NtrC family response regulator
MFRDEFMPLVSKLLPKRCVAMSVVVVDGDVQRRQTLEQALSPDARVDGYGDFASARARLLADPPQWLVTSHRLGAYNGLHLAHLVRSLGLPTRVVVYDDAKDQVLAAEARRSGAFFVPHTQLASKLHAYLTESLPAEDRRDPISPDRRKTFRGGRRATDTAKS